jgi:hypothetical protein
MNALGTAATIRITHTTRTSKQFLQGGTGPGQAQVSHNRIALEPLMGSGVTISNACQSTCRKTERDTRTHTYTLYSVCARERGTHAHVLVHTYIQRASQLARQTEGQREGGREIVRERETDNEIWRDKGRRDLRR